MRGDSEPDGGQETHSRSEICKFDLKGCEAIFVAVDGLELCV